MKPMLADDFDQSKIRFPVIMEPKIDGVRSCNFAGKLHARSMKQHKNKFTTTLFSRTELNGFDGEMTAQAPFHPDLCRITTSALSTIAGEPYVEWWIFDYATAETMFLPYHVRLDLLTSRIMEIRIKHPDLRPIMDRIHIIPNVQVNTLEELLYREEVWLSQGYEGAVIRDPLGYYKQGRSTIREGGMLRIKRFVDAEAQVIAVKEGESNGNEATINELGKTSRSTHQANMIPNGLVGTLVCKLFKDVKDSSGKIILHAGQVIDVAAGKMTHEERSFYFKNQDQILSRVIKFQFFPKGIKDKPRFPTFQTFRSKEDL